MALDVTIIVASFGDPDMWAPLSLRAGASARDQAPLIRLHRDDSDLCSIRNEAASMVRTEWMCFLDADDELEHGYIDAMARVDFDLRAPLVRFVPPGGRGGKPPRIPAGTDNMADGNRLVIGTLVRKAMFDQVGGFREWPMFEDWDLWQRCWLAGATIGFSDAVYRAHVRRGSRNRAPTQTEKFEWTHAIRRANLPHLYADAPATEGVGA